MIWLTISNDKYFNWALNDQVIYKMMFLCRHVSKITTHVRLNQSTINSNIKTKKPLFFESLIKETYIQQPAARAFNVIQNPYSNSKWSKLLKTNGLPARNKESRGFRQKVIRLNNIFHYICTIISNWRRNYKNIW